MIYRVTLTRHGISYVQHAQSPEEAIAAVVRRNGWTREPRATITAEPWQSGRQRTEETS